MAIDFENDVLPKLHSHYGKYKGSLDFLSDFLEQLGRFDTLEEAYEQLEKKINKDNLLLLGLGFMNLYGIGITQDLNKAINLLTKAADAGNAPAQFNLSVMYLKGWDDIRKDVKKGIDLLTKAADAEYPAAQYNLSIHYHDGIGVTKDLKKSVDLLTKAADAQFPEAQSLLGLHYLNGIGVTKDSKKGIDLLTKAADAGYLSAQCELGVRYELGDGVTKDLDKAIDLLTKAADSRFREAGLTVFKLSSHARFRAAVLVLTSLKRKMSEDVRTNRLMNYTQSATTSTNASSVDTDTISLLTQKVDQLTQQVELLKTQQNIQAVVLQEQQTEIEALHTQLGSEKSSLKRAHTECSPTPSANNGTSQNFFSASEPSQSRKRIRTSHTASTSDAAANLEHEQSAIATIAEMSPATMASTQYTK